MIIGSSFDPQLLCILTVIFILQLKSFLILLNPFFSREQLLCSMIIIVIKETAIKEKPRPYGSFWLKTSALSSLNGSITTRLENPSSLI